jgi:hypothetical protein
MRVTKFNTLLRVVYTLGLCLILSQTAAAQTVLNFARTAVNDQTSTSFAVTNPTSGYADVQFTLYGLDGNPVSSGLINPVRHRVAPKGQIAIRAGDLFGAAQLDGWVQVTSQTSGLVGVYLSGDFSNSLEGANSAPALSNQIVPVVRDDNTNKTELVIVNPGAAGATISVTLYNARGDQAGTVASQILAPHGAVRISSALMSAGPGNLSARITSSGPVAATAIMDRGDSLLFVPGQVIDQPASLRIAPHFMTQGGFDPVLVLTNPAGSPVTVNVTILTESGSPIFPASASSRSFTITGNGSISADIRTITGQPIGATVNGWLRIESPNVALSGVVILDQGQAVSSLPLQTAPSDRMIFSQISETASLFTGLVLVNPSTAPAAVDLTLVGEDGHTFAQHSLSVAPNTKFLKLLRDVIPEVADQPGGYLVLRSSIPVYGLGLLGAMNNAFIAGISGDPVPDGFAPNPLTAAPSIVRVEPGTDVQPGSLVRVVLSNVAANPAIIISGQVVTPRQIGPLNPAYEFTMPSFEPGFVTLTVRSNNLESAPKTLRVPGADNGPVQTISGLAFYQKIDVTDSGLDLNRPVMVPIRSARVELYSRSSQTVVAVSQTDARGNFSVPAPFDPNLTIRVMSRLRTSDLRVADNTNGGQFYVLAIDVDGRVPRSDVLIADFSRISGAFNILEVLQRANDTVKSGDPNIVPPALPIFWSTRNRKGTGAINIGQGLIGTTNFNVSTNTAYVLGDRSDDSDEFDDAVIAHEYAHLLAAKFSRDDSQGGPHSVGDMLDPRLAWSEGWANFFSAAVRNDPVWRDSIGPNGSGVIRRDLEINVPANDKPGYWSEASTDTLLWDLFDDRNDPADDVQYPFSEIWAAFTELRDERFVYLPYFLEHFINRNPSSADALRVMVQSRSIDFQPNERPSVTNPFPTPMNPGGVVTGIVDSLTTRRTNLVTSAHFYSFTTTGGAASIRLDITGVGTGGNPNANDLDLFLMDANGRVVDKSDSGLNGQSERIASRLPAGAYVVEIRSYYTRAETGGFVFNSGQYRLTVSVQ